MAYPYARLDSFRDIPAYDDLTSPDIAAAVAAGAHVIVPCCATEAHGAHLPLGTDTIQGIDMCRRAVHRLQQEGIPLVLGPAIPFGPKAILTEASKSVCLRALVEAHSPASRSFGALSAVSARMA